MTDPLLTISIPTFNRRRLLRRNLEALIPQLTDEVAVMVSDNASDDGTWEYLRSLPPRFQVRRNDTNVGALENVRRCLYVPRGQYVWLLCDDDIAPAGAVAKILEAIKSDTPPPFLFLRSAWIDLDAVDSASLSVGGEEAKWVWHGKDSFLETAGQYITVGSSIVIKREFLGTLDLGRWASSLLMPAAVTVFAVGTAGGTLVSSTPFVYCHGGRNLGGYDGLAVFGEEQPRLLKEIRQRFAFGRKAADAVQNASYAGVVLFIVRRWPLRVKGLAMLARHGWRYPKFWKCTVPELGRRLGRAVHWRPAARSIARGLGNLLARGYNWGRRQQDRLATMSFGRSLGRLGANCTVRHPFYLRGALRVSIGDRFAAGPGLRLEAWTAYGEQRFSPEIVIGNNVNLNWNVHIGAIGRLEIHDNVLIGSHVLITDHEHGQTTQESLSLPPISRPLHSKGPVVVESGVWIGEGACILSGVRIGRNAVIGANAVVTKNVAAGSVVGGAPARPLRTEG